MLPTLLICALLGPLSPAPGPAPAPAPATALLGSLPGSLPGAPAVDEPVVERVRFETPDHQVLFGDFHAPRRPQARATAVLLVHGAGESRADYESLAASLASRNFAVFRFDLRGHGESATEDLDWAQLDEEQRPEAWAFTPRDLEAAAAWMLAKDGVHSSAVHLIGAGAGAALVTRHATRDRQVMSVELIEPLVDPLGFEFEDDLAELEGLPLQISVPRGEREELDALLERTGMSEAVSVHASRADAGTLRDDARCAKAIGGFIDDSLEPELRGISSPSR